MVKVVDLRLSPEKMEDWDFIQSEICTLLNLRIEKIKHIELHKRSLDARKHKIVYQAKFLVYIDEVPPQKPIYFNPIQVDSNQKATIIGAGPAGLFAALAALEAGVKPVLFERGKMVRERRRDLAKINKESIVNPESNYCFGEGGAGTYSDGKLYTRSKKRGDVKKVLEWLVFFGVDENILIEAHPHIGTNRLPKIIENIRAAILENGGEIHFESKLTDIQVVEQQIVGIAINEGSIQPVDNLILATGHSARDIYYLLHKRNIKIEAKSFALGVRIEHDQEIINEIQYHGADYSPLLPPAAYALVTQVDGVGVFSFCMCPGGIVAPCATEQNEVVTNGWSPSKRNNPYANSGIVVQVLPEMIPGYQANNPWTCLDFQKKVEQDCWKAAGETQKVPAQRLLDFIENKVSADLPQSSYIPGLTSVDLNTVLPKFIAEKLQKAFVEFGKKMPQFLTNEAVLHAPESRTSSPVRIPRNKETLEHEEVKGLYPCAEGAGYAGGIVSAAVDGMRCIAAIHQKANAV
ncbi:FAD-binding protein [Putridiphycobacter roseus]|uniref:FAD-binding protein n=1 Tax=Putridiphycobacter roseus TaxID=2219161 RepID=A0A2W1N1G1_9FLAO|nr:FAD-binding protein [Putridiphycobacter roseus]PZE16771.1 FAD-binding protein [Putridiphycobacter roseus]